MLTGYFNPAASKVQTIGTPTTGNPVASISHDPEMVVREAAVQDEQFGNSTIMKDEGFSTEKATLMNDRNTPVSVVQCDEVLSSHVGTISVVLSTPSVEEKCETAIMRKPDARVDVVNNTGIPTLDLGDNKTAKNDVKPTVGCEFKRGGKCLIHGCMGVKHVTTMKKWCMKKDGTYGNKYVKKTDYRCQFEGVAVSNASKPDPGTVKKTMSSQRVGNDQISQGTISGISRVALTGLGGDESESLERGLQGRKPD